MSLIAGKTKTEMVTFVSEGTLAILWSLRKASSHLVSSDLVISTPPTHTDTLRLSLGVCGAISVDSFLSWTRRFVSPPVWLSGVSTQKRTHKKQRASV